MRTHHVEKFTAIPLHTIRYKLKYTKYLANFRFESQKNCWGRQRDNMYPIGYALATVVILTTCDIFRGHGLLAPHI